MVVYDVIVQEDKLDGGYFAYVQQLQGCFSDGNTIDELIINIKEAIGTVIDDNNYEIKLIKK